MHTTDPLYICDCAEIMNFLGDATRALVKCAHGKKLSQMASGLLDGFAPGHIFGNLTRFKAACNGLDQPGPLRVYCPLIGIGASPKLFNQHDAIPYRVIGQYNDRIA